MSNLLPGTRMATQEDMQLAFDCFSALGKARGYTVAITGSTLYGDGEDIDLIVVASVDAKCSAAKVAQEFMVHCRHLYYYEQEENGSMAALVFKQSDGTVIDAYIYGLPEG